MAPSEGDVRARNSLAHGAGHARRGILAGLLRRPQWHRVCCVLGSRPWRVRCRPRRAARRFRPPASAAIRIDGSKARNAQVAIDWVFTDLGHTYRTELRHGVLIQDVDPTHGSADLTVTLDQIRPAGPARRRPWTGGPRPRALQPWWRPCSACWTHRLPASPSSRPQGAQSAVRSRIVALRGCLATGVGRRVGARDTPVGHVLRPGGARPVPVLVSTGGVDQPTGSDAGEGDLAR